MQYVTDKNEVKMNNKTQEDHKVSLYSKIPP